MRSKFNAKRTEVDGIVFASKKEAKRYGELKLLERCEEIFNLKCQVKYPFYYSDDRTILGDKMFTYVADFVYEDKNGHSVVEDVKGMKTPVYRLKKKLIEAQWKFEIVEI